MGTTYVNLTDSDILNETASYEDIGIDNAEIVKEYNRLIDVAMNNNTVANWQAVSDYRTNNANVLNKVIISADTINNIIKTILTLEQYAIQKRNQLLIQSDEPTTQAAGDYWIKIDGNKNVLDKEMSAKKAFQKGEVIDKRFVKMRPDVERNNDVRIFFVSNGAVMITIDGTAMADGMTGDYVNVENRNYKKVYKGKVIGENRVLVNI